jgi:hypothetical protein
LGVLPGRVGQAAEAEKPQIKIAGYDYDRVRAIMDGQAGVEGAEVNFHFEDIYAVNRYAFGIPLPTSQRGQRHCELDTVSRIC